MRSAHERFLGARLLVTFAFAVLVQTSVSAQYAPAPVDLPQQTFRSSVDLVTIQASVRDRRGRPMTGLTPGDFEVRDNGELRPVLSLRADLRSPISLAILVDMSGSMRLGPKIAMTRQAFASVRGRAVHVRFGAPRAAVVHPRPDGVRRCADRVRAVRHHLTLRRDSRNGAAARRAVRHA